MARFWTCQRQSKGAKCGRVNPSVKRICVRCGKRRPAKKPVAHKQILKDHPYEVWAVVFGETCNICGATGKTRRLHRDHDHKTGKARGLLCIQCNRALPSFMTTAWLIKAAAYLERSKSLPDLKGENASSNQRINGPGNPVLPGGSNIKRSNKKV